MTTPTQTYSTSSRPQALHPALIAALFALSVLTGLALARAGFAVADYLTAPPPLHGAVVAPAYPALGFTLTDQTGQYCDLRNLEGRAVLLTFGTVADGVNTLLPVLVEARDLLGDDAARVQILFITLDPAHDSPELLGEYAAIFGCSVLALTGRPADVTTLANNYNVTVSRPASGGVQHSLSVALIDPTGQLRTFYTPGITAHEIATDLRTVLAGH